MAQTSNPASQSSQPRKLRVTIISHSDKLGTGAAETYRLMRALRKLDIDARMVVFTRQTYDDNVSVPDTRFSRSMKFLYEHVRILAANGFDRSEKLYNVSLANTGCSIASHRWVKEADVLLLSWTYNGLLSFNGFRQLSRMGKPMVQVMHDMWCATGICHNPHGCTNFERECGCCPQLNSNNPLDLSYRVWKKKKKLFTNCKVTFVAVSSWLEEQCRKSSIMRTNNIVTIPNAFPAETFYTRPSALKKRMPIDYSRKIIIMGAPRLDSPDKGLPVAIDALNHIFETDPKVANTSMAVFFGSVKDPKIFDKLYFPHVYVGKVNDDAVLRELYASSSVVLSTSTYDPFPDTLIEGQAAGCVPVTTGHGAEGDLIEHMVNGYVAKNSTPKEVSKGIIWALNNIPDRNQLHKGIENRYDAPVVAQRYVDLFHSLLARK